MNFCTLLDILKSIKHKFICFSSTPIPTPRSAPLQNRIFVNKQAGFAAEVSSFLEARGAGRGELQLPSTKGKCQVLSVHSGTRLCFPQTHPQHPPGWNCCARGDAALPCQRWGSCTGGEQTRLTVRITLFLVEFVPLSAFFFLFQNEMKCEGFSAVKINCFVASWH